MKNIILLLIITLIGNVPGMASGEAPTSSRKITPIKVGETLPALNLTDTKHRSVSIQSYLETQPIILIYYRGGW